VNIDCKAPTSFCTQGNECSTCLQNSDCMGTPATPLCSQDQLRCVQCLGKNDCKAGQNCRMGTCN
jgi:hypothetical protein